LQLVLREIAPAHERVVTTLKAWGVSVDEGILLGGMEKQPYSHNLAPTHVSLD